MNKDKTILQKGDFVIATKAVKEIVKNSVGQIQSINKKEVIVFFIGLQKLVKTSIDNIKFIDVYKTGKPYKVKICNICHILKDEKEFEINQTDALGRKTTRPSCKSCRTAIDGKKLLLSESKKMDQKKPQGIFKCPICGKISIVGVTANLVKDHDHKTGMARDWICDSCNTGLGRFRDDIELLKKTITYLKKFSK